MLIPFYYLIRQTSVDIQATKGAWLWKLEAIRRSGQGETYYAATGGLEYTFFEIFVSDINLGLVLEYMYDDRGKKATTPFEDDTFLGFRFAFNDEQSTEALIGSIVDNNGDAFAYSLKAGRRIGEHWKLSVESRFYQNISSSDPLYSFRNDDYVQLNLAYHF